MRINPYLNFNGQTEAAFNFYRSVFGGEFSTIQRFKEMPAGEQPMPEGAGERTLHVALPIGETTLMGSDSVEGMGMPLAMGNNVNLSLHPDTKEEAERLFNALSEGGRVDMPFGKMFWGAWFGSFADKFGVQWMVNFDEKTA